MTPPNKRRKIESRVEEISFDPEARSDYLSGFRKRKQQRIKHAQEEAVKKEKALKIESRKQLREQRRKDLETHVQTVNEMLKKARKAEDGDGSDSEDSASKPKAEDKNEEADEGREDEYIDEEKYTTVTVETMKMSGDESSDEAESGEENSQRGGQKSNGDKRIWTKEKPSTSKTKKKKKKKFRYESKVERRAERSKVAAKNSAAAKARRAGE